MLGPTAHVDTFSRDNLPPQEQWPEFRLEGFDYPEYLNAAVELTDRLVGRGFGDRTALIGARPAPHLQGACRLEQQARPGARRGLRREAGQPGADPFGE